MSLEEQIKRLEVVVGVEVGAGIVVVVGVGVGTDLEVVEEVGVVLVEEAELRL